MVIALGKVQEDTSFGLKETLTALYVLAGMFAQWAFGEKK
jgi:hypothetical protein